MAKAKRINLALQGGGAHGAFTWGVLDTLLQDDRIEIAGISGTSAGALNGAAVKSGLATGGRARAREKLDWLWRRVGAVQDPDLARLINQWSIPSAAVSHLIETSPAFIAADFFSRVNSPYAQGIFYSNPLEPIVSELFCPTLCTDQGPAFWICATNVRTGKIKVFDHDEISVDSILASACLPTLFQAVEVTDPHSGETEAYWDGGYTGNPALFPLFAESLPDDILVVNINPLYRADVPITPQQIQNRINEISFNSSLLRELRAIAFVRRLLDQGNLQSNSMKRVLVHMISDDVLMNTLSVATKLVPTPSVLADLKAAGQRAAEAFLERDFDKLGETDSVDLHDMFS